MDAGAGGYYVDDCVDGAYFVEMNVFYVGVVDFGFAGSEQLECMDGGLFDGGGERGGVD